MSARVLAIGFVALVLIWLYVPILVIVLFSFTTSPRLSLPIEDVTLEWYGKALSDPLMTTALVNSLTLAAMTAIVAGVLGAAIAFPAGHGATQRQRSGCASGRRAQDRPGAALLVPSQSF